MTTKLRQTLILPALLLALTISLAPAQVQAHCDTLDGPVVEDARQALAAGDVTPVLKWVRAEDEKQIRAVFDHTTAVRDLGEEAQALADRFLFETLVRIHRASEGAPYTGLKPAGSVEPVIAKADLALEQASVDNLVKAILAHTEEGIRERFNHALETRRHADDSVADGRRYVEAYVEYVHYVEGIAQVVHGKAHHGGEESAAGHAH